MTLVACATCDMPTPEPTDDKPPTCAFCRQQDRVLTVLQPTAGTPHQETL